VTISQGRFQKFLHRLDELKKGVRFDLSLEEDLTLAIMNLVSLEEHFFMTAEKTKKDSYLELLKEVREIRKELLAKIAPQFEGETWCIMKHLLAATMRVMEVGTKYQSDGKSRESKRMFDLAYKVYALFWGVRLKLFDLSGLKKVAGDALNIHTDSAAKPWTLSDIVTKLVDCCKE
jgi:hypothetical protein